MLRNQCPRGLRSCQPISRVGPLDVAAHRPSAYDCNNRISRQRPCVPPPPQSAKHTQIVLGASVASASLQNAQAKGSWLPSGFNLEHLPRPDLSWLQGNQGQEHMQTLHELQGAQQVVLRQLVELEQQLAAAEAAEAAELQHLNATSTTSTPSSSTGNATATTAAAASPPVSVPLVPATSSSHIVESSSQQPGAVVEGMQLVRWADALITHHLGHSRIRSASATADRSGRSQQTMDAALHPGSVMDLDFGLAEANVNAAAGAHSHALESAEGMQLVRWSQALITRHLEHVKDQVDGASSTGAGMLVELQQRWEEELTRFNAEGACVLQDLAALQQQHLRLAISDQEHPLLPRWGRTLADIRVLAAVSAAAAAGGKLAAAVCEAPPVTSREQLEAAVREDDCAISPPVAEGLASAPQHTSDITAVSEQPPMSSATAHEADASTAGSGRAADAQPAKARAGRHVAQDPPAWDFVGQLLKHYLSQGHSARVA